MLHLPLTCPRRLLSLTILFASACLATACGGSYKVAKVKEYRMALTAGDSAFASTFKTLIGDYNKLAGAQVLTFVDDAAGANSSIQVVKGLVHSNADGLGPGKVGLGQWLSETKVDSPLSVIPGKQAKETISYSMRVEFDYDYLTTKSHYELQKLFFHEVGHGLELNHNSANIHDVMYPDVGIGQTKDFDAYFKYVRSYIADL